MQKAAFETENIDYLPIKGAQSTVYSHCNRLYDKRRDVGKVFRHDAFLIT